MIFFDAFTGGDPLAHLMAGGRVFGIGEWPETTPKAMTHRFHEGLIRA